MFVLRGNYTTKGFKDIANNEMCTIVKPIDTEGKCLLKTINIKDLGFTPSWKPISVHGYHQSCDLPKGHRVDMTGAVSMWNARLPENGAIFFFNSKEERGRFLGY